MTIEDPLKNMIEIKVCPKTKQERFASFQEAFNAWTKQKVLTRDNPTIYHCDVCRGWHFEQPRKFHMR